jgi:hypothetical protein
MHKSVALTATSTEQHHHRNMLGGIKIHPSTVLRMSSGNAIAE